MKLRPIEVIDFDDTLIPSSITPDFIAWLTQELINKYNLATNEKEAATLILSNYKRCGCAPSGIAERFNLDNSWVERIYREIGAHLAKTVARRCKPDEGLLDALRIHKSRGHPLVIATQSNREAYLDAVLEQYGELARLFPPHLRFGRIYKRLPRAYRPVTQKLEELFPGIPWRMSDDSLPNLPPAKQAGAEGTNWISPEEPLPSMPEGVDTHFPTLESYLRHQH